MVKKPPFRKPEAGKINLLIMRFSHHLWLVLFRLLGSKLLKSSIEI